jgi:hypothetical protein
MSEIEQCMKALEIIGRGMIQKSATYPNLKVARARRICKAIQTPAGAVLAKRILQLQRQQSMRMVAYGPTEKSMGRGRVSKTASATAQFEAIVKKHLNEIQKSDTGHKSAKILKAQATARAVRENPDLAKAVMAEHRQAVHAAFIGGRQ